MTIKKEKKPRKAAAPDLPPPGDRTPEQNRIALRRKVALFYDLQRLRIQAGGRTENKLDGEKKKRATTIELTQHDAMVLEHRSNELETLEKHALGDIQDHLNQIGFYRDVLNDKEHYRGIGPTMAGIILSSFDIYREDTVSKMWAFAGLRPMPCLRCKVCHTVVEVGKKHPKAKCFYAVAHKDMGSVGSLVFAENCYQSGKAQKPVPGEKLPYNSWLRTKLVGVLGSVMLRVGSPWRKYYDEYKHRKETAGWGVSDGHRHNAAIRYMIKMLLLDIWKKWREYEKLPVRPSYHEEKQGGHGYAPKPVNGVSATPPSEFDAEVEAELAQL